MNFDRFGGRKAIISIILFVTVTAFVFLGHATFTNWADFIKWIFAAFVVGNAIEKFQKNGNNNNNKN